MAKPEPSFNDILVWCKHVSTCIDEVIAVVQKRMQYFS